MGPEKGSVFSRKTMEEYEEAIRSEHGIISSVARKLGITRNSVICKLRNHESLNQLVISEREGLIDMAEHVLYKKLKEDHYPAAVYVLSTIAAQGRGLSQKRELTINRGKDENVEYDLSRLTDTEKELLNELTIKIHKPKTIEDKSSDEQPA